MAEGESTQSRSEGANVTNTPLITHIVKGQQFQFVVSNSATPRRQDRREIKRHAARQSARPRPTKATHHAWLKSQLVLQENAHISNPWTPVPAKVGNELSWVKFPMEMSPYMVRDVARCSSTLHVFFVLATNIC